MLSPVEITPTIASDQHKAFENFTIVSPPRQGWSCPKCNRVYSPDVQECVKCNSNILTFPPLHKVYSSPNLDSGYASFVKTDVDNPQGITSDTVKSNQLPKTAIMNQDLLFDTLNDPLGINSIGFGGTDEEMKAYGKVISKQFFEEYKAALEKELPKIIIKVPEDTTVKIQKSEQLLPQGGGHFPSMPPSITKVDCGCNGNCSCNHYDQDY